MRVYLPATVRLLDTWVRARRLAPPGDGPSDPGLRAHTVTAALAAGQDPGAGGAQVEELEYDATLAAAAESLAMLAAEPAAVPRRVVVAADVPDETVRADPARGPSAVRLHQAIPWARVACAHLDDADIDVPPTPQGAATAEAAAAEAAAAEAATAEAAAEALVDRPLSWYATQELADVVADLLAPADAPPGGRGEVP